MVPSRSLPKLGSGIFIDMFMRSAWGLRLATVATGAE